MLNQPLKLLLTLFKYSFTKYISKICQSFIDSLTLPAVFVIFYFQVYIVCESTVLKKENYLEILMDLRDGTVVLLCCPYVRAQLL